MNSNYYKRSVPSPLVRVVSLLMAMIVGGGGLFALLVATGMVQLPFGRKPEAEKPRPKPEGTPVLLSARFIPAYTQITRDQVLDEKTGEFTVAYVRPEDATREGFLPFEKILGRVLKADKTASHAFTEKDFLPEGTQPGLAAGVPSGKRALVIPADRIGGINGLKLGDRVDVLMSMPIEPNLNQSGTRGGQTLGLPAHGGQSGASGRLRRAGVFAIVQDGIIVMPMTTHQVPVLNSVLGRDGKFQTKAAQDITIAVEPGESVALMQALAVDTEIYCALRSGRPGDSSARTPDLPPLPPPPPPVKVELIVGRKREIKNFDAPGITKNANPLPIPRKNGSSNISTADSDAETISQQP